MKVTQGKNLSGRQIFILIALFVLACICVISAVAVIGMKAIPLTYPTSSTSIPLPPHFVNDLYDNGNIVTYFIVVDKSFSKDNATKLITYYQGKHSGYNVLNIIFFCDNTYAQEKYLSFASTLSDNEFYKHVLFWYQTGQPGTKFLHDITNPDLTDFPTLGNACR